MSVQMIGIVFARMRLAQLEERIIRTVSMNDRRTVVPINLKNQKYLEYSKNFSQMKTV